MIGYVTNQLNGFYGTSGSARGQPTHLAVMSDPNQRLSSLLRELDATARAQPEGAAATLRRGARGVVGHCDVHGQGGSWTGGAARRTLGGRPRQRRPVAARAPLSASRQVLVESEAKLRSLYAAMSEGVALDELIFDQSGKPVDYVLLDVNRAFESHTGLRSDSVIGRRATEVYGTNEAPLDRYAAVAIYWRPNCFEETFTPMKKTFAIPLLGKNRFATVFQDITEARRVSELTEELLQRLQFALRAVPWGVAGSEHPVKHHGVG